MHVLCLIAEDTTLLVTKKIQDLPGPQKHFPQPCHKPAMIKYINKQQLEGLGSIISSPSGVWGIAQPQSILAYLSPENVPGGNNYGYFSLHKHV